MNEPAASSAATSKQPAEAALPPPTPVGLRILVMIVVAGLAAGLSSVAIQRTGEVFAMPEKFASFSGGNISTEDQQAADRARSEQTRQNTTVWVGLAGAILGGLCALATGCLQRAGKRIAVGLLAGLVLGGGLGAAAGFESVTLFQSFKASLAGQADIPEHLVMLMHGVTWGLIGGGIGLAAGLCAPRLRVQSVLTAGLVGGLLGCVGGAAFPLVCGVAAPLANTALPLPEAGTERLIWLGFPSVLVGIGLGRAI
uniref:Uncharacterized protein n=1 Tax=Schlesneria paludicola TaxID=360056 RepID=A0A7C2K0N7_9PLAN